jgi:hypothetical protein
LNLRFDTRRVVQFVGHFFKRSDSPPGPKRWSNLIGLCHRESMHTAQAKSSTFVVSPPRAEARFGNFTSRVASGMPAA